MPRYKNRDGVRIQFTAEEETARDAEEKAWADGALDRALLNFRDKRNSLLTQTDWWGASDNIMTDAQKKYRQDLRDLTNGLDTVEKVNAVTWPTKPGA
mgnify:CR=1 FL=1|tara:strand:+ start:1440 stop:1733 length:294 start_codon:yes stop_codon:yes gene_type:complete